MNAAASVDIEDFHVDVPAEVIDDLNTRLAHRVRLDHRAGCVFDSGRAFGLSRYWSPDGTITLEGGYVVADGELHHAEVVDVPRLTDLQRTGESVPIALRWPGGELTLTATTTTSMWMTMGPGLPYGVMPGWQGPTYSVSFASCEWDGEAGSVYLERSDPLA